MIRAIKIAPTVREDINTLYSLIKLIACRGDLQSPATEVMSTLLLIISYLNKNMWLFLAADLKNNHIAFGADANGWAP